MLLYHGTCAVFSELAIGSCVTDDLEHAAYYAECAVEQAAATAQQPVILVIEAEAKDLAVDIASLQEPLTSLLNDTEEQIFDKIEQLCQRENVSAWKDLNGMHSLQLVHSAKLKTTQQVIDTVTDH